MKKRNETERKCPRGRIIIDLNNKTGLCPKCQKKGNTIVAGFALATVGVIIKKYGGKIVNGASDKALKEIEYSVHIERNNVYAAKPYFLISKSNNIYRHMDYSRESKITRDFFATVQNKMHYAVHGNTAAELITESADYRKAHMGVTSWKNAPSGKIVKADVSIAKAFAANK